MRCIRVVKFIPLHVGGDLGGRRARAVADHLVACAPCRHTADEYHASRDLLRTLSTPPEFESAFYERIRNSVLAQLERDRTLAPPRPVSLAPLFNWRLAYAASLALLVIAGAVSLHSPVRRTTNDDKQLPSMLADVNGNHAALHTKTQTTSPAKVGSNNPRTFRFQEMAAQRAQGARLTATPTQRTSPPVNQNLTAPNAIATRLPLGEEVATDEPQTAAQPEVSRIEMQTSDPNIRIIWLLPKADETQLMK